MINVALPTEDFKREPGKPVVFFTGDSTVKNADKDEDGMWGWGSQAYTIFNPKKISIDYAVMEKSKEIYTLPAEFGWSDLGSWGSLMSPTESLFYIVIASAVPDRSSTKFEAVRVSTNY